MTETSDVVVVGGGTNTLIAAGYLARAGLSVTVIEEHAAPGGGVATEELTLPGFRHDPASSFHIDLQFNPLIAADELGLIADYGLRYVAPDPAMIVQCDGGETITMRGTVDATAAEIARYSEHDAQAYRDLIEEWEQVIGLHTRRLSGPPGTVPETDPEAAGRFAQLAGVSAVELVNERFEDERTRKMLLAPAAVGPLTMPGTGFLPVSFAGMLSRVSWVHPVGGSNALVLALVALIEGHGGRVLGDRLVERVVVEQGRATGVVTTSGERFDATTAVLSGAHVTQLPALLGPGHLPDDFVEALDHWRPGSSVFVVHLAVPRVPTYRTGDGPEAATVGAFGTSEGIAAQRGDVAEGRLSGPDRWMMAICSSVIDDSRAPGDAATLKLLTAAPYALEGDAQRWEEVKDDYADQLVAAYAAVVDGYQPGDELARTVHSPLDIERINRHNVEGGFQGGEMSPTQSGPNRPVKGWAAYRMPVAGLYQTGGSTFPGGGVSGWPGRNAARAILDDAGVDVSGFWREAGQPETLPAPRAAR